MDKGAWQAHGVSKLDMTEQLTHLVALYKPPSIYIPPKLSHLPYTLLIWLLLKFSISFCPLCSQSSYKSR